MRTVGACFICFKLSYTRTIRCNCVYETREYIYCIALLIGMEVKILVCGALARISTRYMLLM